MADILKICISGFFEDDKIRELKTSGADDFLAKPLDIDELIRRVCRLLDIETGPSGGVRDSRFGSSPTGRSPARCVPSPPTSQDAVTSGAQSSGWTRSRCARA